MGGIQQVQRLLKVLVSAYSRAKAQVAAAEAGGAKAEARQKRVDRAALLAQQ